MAASIQQLNLAQFESLYNEGALVLDLRSQHTYCDGMIPGSLYAGKAFFSSGMAKSIITPDQEVVLICETGSEEACAAQLDEEGFGANVEGMLQGGFDTWQSSGNAVDVVISIPPDEFILDMKFSNPSIADIRSKEMYKQSHLPEADNINPEKLMGNARELPKEQIWYLYGADGDYALSVISFLKREGLHNYYHIEGGYKALLAAEADMVSDLPKKKEG